MTIIIKLWSWRYFIYIIITFFLLIKICKACYRPDVSFGSVDLDPMCQDPFAEKIKVDFQDQLLEEILASAKDSDMIKVIIICSFIMLE